MRPFRNFFRKSKKKNSSERKKESGKERFVTRQNAHKHGMVTDLVGRGFAQKNERLMNARKKILADLGVSKKTINVLEKLFRLRKAGELASRGVVSESAAKEMIKFLKERKTSLKAKGESKEHLEVFDFGIETLETAIKKGAIDLSKVNEIRKGQIDVGVNSHYVFDPQGKQKPKPLEVNFIGTRLVQGVAQDLIELSLGNKYNSFIKREQNEKRRI